MNNDHAFDQMLFALILKANVALGAAIFALNTGELNAAAAAVCDAHNRFIEIDAALNSADGQSRMSHASHVSGPAAGDVSDLLIAQINAPAAPVAPVGEYVHFDEEDEDTSTVYFDFQEDDEEDYDDWDDEDADVDPGVDPGYFGRYDDDDDWRA